MRIVLEKEQTKIIVSTNDIWNLLKCQLKGSGFDLLVNGTSLEITTQLYRGSSRSNLEIEDNHDIMFCIKPIKEIKPCQESGKTKKRGS